VIDECHHVANTDAQRGRLASLLARTCDSLILTSATPHNGRPEGFANLMNMLDPTAVADPSNYTKDEIKGLFVRRFKKDIEDEVGQHFRKRQTEVEPYVQATEPEEKMLARIRGLKFHTLNRKTIGADKDILFSTTLFKAFLSSPHACLETVENRLKSVAEKLAQTGISTKMRRDLENDQQVLDMLKGQLELLADGEFAKLKALTAYLDGEVFLKELEGANTLGEHDDPPLAFLPEAEHSAWEKLWAEVEQLRAQAEGKGSDPEKSGKAPRQAGPRRHPTCSGLCLQVLEDRTAPAALSYSTYLGSPVEGVTVQPAGSMKSKEQGAEPVQPGGQPQRLTCDERDFTCPTPPWRVPPAIPVSSRCRTQRRATTLAPPRRSSSSSGRSRRGRRRKWGSRGARHLGPVRSGTCISGRETCGWRGDRPLD
jgi:hypothetical protein